MKYLNSAQRNVHSFVFDDLSGTNEPIKKLATKICANITMKYIASVMQSEQHNSIGTLPVDQLFVDFLNFEPNFPFPESTQRECTEHVVSLADAGIISCPWKRDSLAELMISFSKNDFVWKEDANHRLLHIAPYDIYLVIGGNHSIACGSIFGKGFVHCDLSIDLTPVLRTYNFNGRFFINPKGKKLNRPRFPELGVLFELGKALILS